MHQLSKVKLFPNLVDSLVPGWRQHSVAGAWSSVEEDNIVVRDESSGLWELIVRSGGWNLITGYCECVKRQRTKSKTKGYESVVGPGRFAWFGKGATWHLVRGPRVPSSKNRPDLIARSISNFLTWTGMTYSLGWPKPISTHTQSDNLKKKLQCESNFAPNIN